MTWSPLRALLLTGLALALVGLPFWPKELTPGGTPSIVLAQTKAQQAVAAARAELNNAVQNEKLNPTKEVALVTEMALQQYNAAVAARIAEIQASLKDLAEQAAASGKSSQIASEIEALEAELAELKAPAPGTFNPTTPKTGQGNTPAGGGTIVSAGSTLVSESCTPANGAIDPGETVTVSFCVKNTGGANTTNLVGTLLATGGVTNPSGPQNYGVVVAGGPAVCRNFTFTATGTCGGTLTASIQFQDGANNLGTVTYVFTLGAAGAPVTKSFTFSPGVAIPDSTPAGVNIPFVVAGVGSIGDVNFRIDGTTCNTTNPSLTVGVDHSWVGDLKFTLTSPGGTAVVLMNRPGGGTFGSSGNNFCQTLLDDDGAFPSIQSITSTGAPPLGPPYTGTFKPQNPLSAFDGQTADGNWNLNVSDNAAGDTGFVRAFSLIFSPLACATGCAVPCVLTCPANIVKSNDPNQCGAVVTYPAPTSTGTCGTITCSPASGSFFPVGTTTVTCQASGGGQRPVTDAPTACQTITESTSQAIVNNNSVSCNAGGLHTDNSYWRAFALPSFGINGAWDVQSVDIGVELASCCNTGAPSAGKAGFSKKTSNGSGGVKAPSGATQPITVRLYTSSMPFPTGYPGSLTLIGQTNTTVADQADTILNIPVTGTAPAGSQLVVEVFTPDGQTAGNSFFIGSNTALETGPSYLSAAGCGVNTPTTTAALGFPNMHIVMNVNGCTQVVGTGPTCQFTVTVNDTQPPTITCPAPIFVAAAVTCPAAGCKVVNFTTTATDNCPGVTVVCNPPSGSCFPVGTTTVTCTATDASGNTATCSFTVEVFSACLVDESNPGNVVLFNTLTGEYRFCCNGQLLATGTGVLTIRGCIGTITDQKGTRKVTITFDFTANGKGAGTASLFLNGSTNPKCTITDMDMSNNVCTCPAGGGGSPVLK
jgi:subtilisin-like proprotein convertase family protein